MGNTNDYTKQDDDEIEIEIPPPAEPITKSKSDDTLTKLREKLIHDLKSINERLEIERIKKHVGMSNECEHYEKRRNDLITSLDTLNSMTSL
ncbi:hypothetical protein FACS189472_07940 [Alphaproteobacteria bacterium]|nr:hypothetical protein FACS189472_07940 [Alphaproteobacteria bacterium]